MQKPVGLRQGDKVAVVSLSSGILGEPSTAHQLALGIKRLESFGLEPVLMPHSLKGLKSLQDHPEWRAEDLKTAFQDSSIKGIICAIGGEDTYRLLPYLMEDQEFIQAVKQYPKLFTGFSDTTINHLMFQRLGMVSFYGPNFLSDLAELEEDMLPYTKRSFSAFFENKELKQIEKSDWWYEERTDFSLDALGTKRIRHEEKTGVEVLQGNGKATGRLLGGCLESLYDCIVGELYENQPKICRDYSVFPTSAEWQGSLLFLETSEEKPAPEKMKKMLQILKKQGIFSNVNGVMIGKPQNECYYTEYKQIIKEVIDDETLPVLYNLPFGHAFPRCIVPYSIEATLDTENRSVTFNEPYFAEKR